jgi:hypothetical protein
VTVTVTIYVPGGPTPTTTLDLPPPTTTDAPSATLPTTTAPPSVTQAPTVPDSSSLLTVITVVPTTTTFYGNIKPAPTDTIVPSTLTVITLTPSTTTATPTATAPPQVTATPQVSVSITIPLRESKELVCEYNATNLSDVQYDVVQKVKLILRRINRQIRNQRISSLGRYITRLVRAVETGLDGDCRITEQNEEQDFF